MLKNMMPLGVSATYLLISQDILGDLLNALSTPQTRESVGVLIGNFGKVNSAVRLLNSTAGHDLFHLGAAEIARASRYALKNKQEILAVYHSHPSGDLGLSKRDQFALEKSSWPWLIICLEGSVIRYRCYAAKTCRPIKVIVV